MYFKEVFMIKVSKNLFISLILIISTGMSITQAMQEISDQSGTAAIFAAMTAMKEVSRQVSQVTQSRKGLLAVGLLGTAATAGVATYAWQAHKAKIDAEIDAERERNLASIRETIAQNRERIAQGDLCIARAQGRVLADQLGDAQLKTNAVQSVLALTNQQLNHTENQLFYANHSVKAYRDSTDTLHNQLMEYTRNVHVSPSANIVTQHARPLSASCPSSYPNPRFTLNDASLNNEGKRGQVSADKPVYMNGHANGIHAHDKIDEDEQEPKQTRCQKYTPSRGVIITLLGTIATVGFKIYHHFTMKPGVRERWMYHF